MRYPRIQQHFSIVHCPHPVRDIVHSVYDDFINDPGCSDADLGRATARQNNDHFGEPTPTVRLIGNNCEVARRRGQIG
jgi:hypothetical protein